MQDQPMPPHKPVTDIDIQALVDGQLDAPRTHLVRQTLLRDSSARARYHDLLAQRRLLAAWWRQFS